MFTNFTGATSSRKRKMNEANNANTVVPALSVNQHDHLRRNESLVARDFHLHVDETGSPLTRPFPSFTALLMGEDSDNEDKQLRDQTEQIEKIIETHTDHMRSTLANLWRSNYHATVSAAAETKAMRLKEKEKEVDNMKQILDYYRKQSDRWEARAKALEQTVTSLKVAMRNTLEDVRDEGWRRPYCAGCQGMQEEDDGESSFVDSGPATSKVKCSVCKTKMATVLMWPCQHVSVCLSCEARTATCPLCRSPKAACYSVYVS